MAYSQWFGTSSTTNTSAWDQFANVLDPSRTTTTTTTAPTTTTSTAPAPTTTTDPASAIPGLNVKQANAYQALMSILSAFDLGALAPLLFSYAQQNYDQATQYYLVQQTPEWKSRFAGNELLKQKGLAQLDPATYLDLERSYAQALKSYSVPQGMFGRADFAQWIGSNVSPQEIKSRVQLAADNLANADPYFRNSLAAMGVDTGHQIAYFLDQNRALPFLQRQEQAAQIGAAALRNHLALNPETANQLASIGVSQAQAEQGYSDIAKELPRLHQLAQITPGADFTQQTGEQQILFGNAEAARQAFHLVNTEEARFSGSSGLGSNIYHPAYGVNVPLMGAY